MNAFQWQKISRVLNALATRITQSPDEAEWIIWVNETDNDVRCIICGSVMPYQPWIDVEEHGIEHLKERGLLVFT